MSPLELMGPLKPRGHCTPCPPPLCAAADYYHAAFILDHWRRFRGRRPLGYDSQGGEMSVATSVLLNGLCAAQAS